MKKITLILFCLIALQMSSFAQIYKQSIGLTYSSSNLGIFRPYLTYRHRINDKSRIDLTAHFSGSFSQNLLNYNFGLSAYYQRVWNIKGGLRWFLGAGAEFGTSRLTFQNELMFVHRVGVGGQIGLEYDFNQHNVPLILGVNYRSTIQTGNLISPNLHLGSNAGISLHYTLK